MCAGYRIVMDEAVQIQRSQPLGMHQSVKARSLDLRCPCNVRGRVRGLVVNVFELDVVGFHIVQLLVCIAVSCLSLTLIGVSVAMSGALFTVLVGGCGRWWVRNDEAAVVAAPRIERWTGATLGRERRFEAIHG